MRATPVRRPSEASSPMVLNENDRSERPEIVAAMFCATSLPSRMACWAVGGWAWPGFPISGTKAQSPTAQTSLQPRTCRNEPFSLAHGTEETIGDGTVPAVQIRVRQATGS